jgi:hypothetical protein
MHTKCSKYFGKLIFGMSGRLWEVDIKMEIRGLYWEVAGNGSVPCSVDSSSKETVCNIKYLSISVVLARQPCTVFLLHKVNYIHRKVAAL